MTSRRPIVVIHHSSCHQIPGDCRADLMAIRHCPQPIARCLEWQDTALLPRLVYTAPVVSHLLDVTSSQPTSLLGSSFGIPEVNATFDYVVGNPIFMDLVSN